MYRTNGDNCLHCADVACARAHRFIVMRCRAFRARDGAKRREKAMARKKADAELMTGLGKMRAMVSAATDAVIDGDAAGTDGGTDETPSPVDEMAAMMARKCPPGKDWWMCEGFRACPACWREWLVKGERKA